MRMAAVGASCVALSAALLVLALPPADFGVLGWACLAANLAFVRGRGFAFGFLAMLAVAMLAAWLTTTGWLYRVSNVPGDAAWHYVGFLILALPMGIVGGLLGERAEPLGARDAMLVASVAVAVELALTLYLPVHLALTQFRSPAMLALASVGGIWLPSYLVWLANVLAASAIDEIARNKPVRAPIARLALVASLLAISWPVSRSRSVVESPAPRARTSEGQILLGAIQTTSGELERLMSMHMSLNTYEPEVVVWPELSAVAICAGGDSSALAAAALRAGAAPIATTFQDDARPMPHNVASIVCRQGESRRYRKRKLFGGETAMHAPGSEAVAVPHRGRAVGLANCFDSCFPKEMLRTATASPNVAYAILPCMGPESPFGFTQAIHGAYTPFRSAELGIPVARGESSAFAMIVDRDGRIVSEALPGYEGAISGYVTPGPRWTFYRIAGDWFAWLCAAATAGWAIGSIRARYSKIDLDITAPDGSNS